MEVNNWLHASTDLRAGKKRRRYQFGHDGVEWINLAQNGAQWQSLVNTVMYFRVA
jgi:hypothetical protein